MKESAERVGMACLVPNEPANRHLPTIRVHDEFGKLRAAIVHDGSNAIDITLDDLPPEETVQAARAEDLVQGAARRAARTPAVVCPIDREPALESPNPSHGD